MIPLAQGEVLPRAGSGAVTESLLPPDEEERHADPDHQHEAQVAPPDGLVEQHRTQEKDRDRCGILKKIVLAAVVSLLARRRGRGCAA